MARYSDKEQVLSLAVYVYFEIKVLLDREGLSKALLCNSFITVVATQTEGQENKSVFLEEGKCQAVRLGHMSKI